MAKTTISTTWIFDRNVYIAKLSKGIKESMIL